MKLDDIFTQLTHGEFSQLSIGGTGQGAITEANYEAVLSHINLGLTALFRRFPLKEGRVKLRPVPEKRDYPLADKFAITNKQTREQFRYILDELDNKFNETTLIKIERVLDKNEDELPLNMEGMSESFFTPSLNSVRIPQGWTEDVTLVYRQNHPKLSIPLGYFEPERVEVDLPYTYLEALLYFVASRAHNPVGLQNEFHKGNSYYAKYEQVCAELERQNVKPDTTYNNGRLARGGWV